MPGRDNLVIFSGTVYKEPRRSVSPSGIPHCQFILEHHSRHIEAGFNRRVWCWIPIVINGKIEQNIAQCIVIGVSLNIQGFLCSYKGRHGLYKIVLHAKKIALIESGD
ncbi:primosomal replication protein N [Candidatus Erwinia haradaeae]|uniref:Replication restart protein PriB n=1 Tax=Candidatus Erwinia haradaeae TaxID=1922217 RepID=A0A451DNA6_9GAMM|nr:primosomal replication protein N [Candidatus Erwinia haradaeae]VFP88263.1 Primosomal replication protein N [Candidatus Erwinia haradaeae]